VRKAISRLRHNVQRLREEPRRWRFLCSRVLWRTRLGAVLRLKIQLEDQIRLYFHPASLPAMLWLNPQYGADERLLMRCLAQPGDTVIDIGANVGLLSLTAAKVVGPTGRVIAIEPSPRTAGYLAQNVVLNGLSCVEPHAVALGAAEERIGLVQLHTDDQNFVAPATEARVAVPMKRLDTVLAESGLSDTPINVLKLDVEGYELSVLRGGSSALARTRVVLFECWRTTYARYGHRVEEVFDLLAKASFRVVRPKDPLTVLHPHDIGSACEDLAAVRDLKWFANAVSAMGDLAPKRRDLEARW
jgi:FkbM family methyltransferase